MQRLRRFTYRSLVGRLHRWLSVLVLTVTVFSPFGGIVGSIPAASAQVSPTTEPLLQQSSFTYLGAFNLPTETLGSTWGFGSYAGCCGLGTYGVTYNAAHNSIFIGGHPYEQRIAEIAIPALLAGTPTANALTNLIDPLEGKLNSINPSDPNGKIIGSALVYRTSDSFEKNRHSICLGIEPSQGGMSLSRTCTGLPFFCKPMAQIPWAIACKRRRFDRDNPALLTQ